jgi:hypothetical protein
MSNECDTPDFMFPLLADVFYPIVKQNSYGQPQKEWVFDRSVSCDFSGLKRSSRLTEDVKPNAFIVLENQLDGRTKSDLRYSARNESNAITGILVTNIRTSTGQLVYKESAGPRAGKGTIYEVATITPFVGPSNTIEHYSVILRRAENQAVGD